MLTLVGMPGELVKVFQDHQKTRCQTAPEAGIGNHPNPSWLGLKKKKFKCFKGRISFFFFPHHYIPSELFDSLTVVTIVQ